MEENNNIDSQNTAVEEEVQPVQEAQSQPVPPMAASDSSENEIKVQVKKTVRKNGRNNATKRTSQVSSASAATCGEIEDLSNFKEKLSGSNVEGYGEDESSENRKNSRERGEKRAEQCGAMLSFKLPTEGCSPEETAERIRRIVNGEEHPLPYRRTKQLGKDERALRKEVFMDEQGFAGEFDEADERATHLVFYNGGEPAACCRILPGERRGEYVLGRLAVKKPLRGKGVGAYAVRAAEESARLCGGREMVLSAQVRAQGFYERCGYAAAGEVFPEEGVPHVRMRKKL